MQTMAAIGACVWLGLVTAATAGALPWRILEPLFLLAPLVLVPLALRLIDRNGPPTAIRAALPMAALAAAASLTCRVGPIAGGLAVGWLLLTLGLAAWGALRYARRRAHRDAAETAFDLALLAIPVGGAWFVASRLGLAPMGFEEPIVLLTAIHFHFAAFVALVWTGCAARRLPASIARRLAVTGVAIGTPLLAAGITFAPWLELAGAITLAAALGGLAVAVVRRVCPSVRAGRWWLCASALAIMLSMPLAVAYAFGQVAKPLISLDLMARLHGTLNALGFGLCGLVGWTRADRSDS
jgi:hypothetical protein